MKYIEKKSIVPLPQATGSISDTTNIEDKTTNTYSARVIDELVATGSGGSGTSNLKYVACVARYENGAWRLLDDEGHRPLNVASIETIHAGAFKINYNFTATKVLSLVSGVDETYAGEGYSCGASVGLDSSTIVLSKIQQFDANINHDGTNYTTNNSKITSMKNISHASLGDYLRIEHENQPGLINIISTNEYDWKMLGYSTNYVNLQAYLKGVKQSLPLPSGKTNFSFMKGTWIQNVPSVNAHPTSSNIWMLGLFEIDTTEQSTS